MRYRILLILLTPWFLLQAEAADVDFHRDVRPILSDACFHCHGPDESSREADLRLDRKAAAIDVLGDSADESELLRRIRSTDSDEIMPPPDSGKSLDASQVSVIERWIDTGSPWPEHWSFVPPSKAEVPVKYADRDWVRKPFDAFVLERLADQGLTPADIAPRHTLIRRLSFDLTGLPPKWTDVQTFLADQSPDAYEKVVDRLLASMHFGERMAADWLDAARYSDTDGYQADATRTNWPWRDWVVRAFNQNMPFDQFTIEQFAGDLLTDPTPDQIIATCFHRNHMTNGEGGRDPEESRVDYVIDRVNTMGTVWLGLTLGCTQCHSHKYDPISQNEYYQLNAFFNSIDEDGKAGGGAKPFYEYESPYVSESLKASLADSQEWLESIEDRLRVTEANALSGFDEWLDRQIARVSVTEQYSSWQRPGVKSLTATHGARISQNENGELVASGPNARHEDYQITVTPQLQRITGMRLTILPNEETGGLSANDDGHFILTNMKINVAREGSSQVREVDVASAVADYEKEKTGRSYGPVKTVLDDDPRSGWTSMGTDSTEPRVAVFGFAKPLELVPGEHLAMEFRHRSLTGYANLRRFTLEFTDEVGPVLTSLGDSPLERLAKSRFENLDDKVQADIREQFLVDQPSVLVAREQRARAKARHDSYLEKPVRVMVLAERPKPRETHVLERGVWDKKGLTVQRGVPAVLPPLPNADSDPSRLDLAMWLVSKENPLTARVYVNRIWQMLFGHGIVRTPGDFGMQGDPPTHPRVLDWLAADFVQSGWNVKHLIKQIVMSATYRQSSDVDAELLQRDPENRLLNRNSRFRLPSWMIRDAALAVSNQLDARVGGPPVYPHQPPGAWSDATMGRFHYQPSVGGDLYRRSLYTFWRRSVGPTGMFDASKRRNCEVRVVRTNTPLHALTLLNDETYVEAARALATRVLKTNDTAPERIAAMFREVLSRSPLPEEEAVLSVQLSEAITEYTENETDARLLVSIGQLAKADDVDSVELAAYTTIASTILNLDEAVTRE